MLDSEKHISLGCDLMSKVAEGEHLKPFKGKSLTLSYSNLEQDVQYGFILSSLKEIYWRRT